jgi:hypothetical protein
MLEDVKHIHATLTELEAQLDALPNTIKVKRARVLARNLHEHLQKAVEKHADALPGDVVAFSGGTPKPPR